MYSETSTDGVNWTINQSSLRKVKISKEGTDYISMPSLLVTTKWLKGSYNRFRLYKEGAGGVSITPVTDTINGTTVDSDTGVVLNAAPSTTQSVEETNNEPTSKVTVKNRFKKGEKKQILNSKITNMFNSDQIAVLREQGYTNEKLNDMADDELNHLKGCM